jgi:hypothetical protein
LYKNKSFLYQKYVVEGFFCQEIADNIFSARTTVLKYLKEFGIEVRGTGSNQRRKRGLAFGAKVQARKVVEYKKERQAIERMVSLRGQGYSYQKIADILNTVNVPTKTRKGEWSRKQVWISVNTGK